ncbi:MAG: helix-turn-helix domain-containing protein [Gemmatimonadota bacterium]
MSTRSSLLDVTARIYSEFGWRGTTTRRIAEAAGVNEVTIFRQFGSKEALLLESIQSASREESTNHLPEVPQALRRELVAWALAHHTEISSKRQIIRNCLAEWEEHPELAPVVCEGGMKAFADTTRYLAAARAGGLLGAEGSLEAATVMLMNAVFMDAMTRDVGPLSPPHTVPEVVEMFVDLVLRALGAVEGA